MIYFTIYMFLFFFPQTQSVNEIVRNKIMSVYNGNAEAILKELPELEKKYSDNPGIKYLRGILTVDAVKAVQSYEQVANQFRESEWADDALYRIYEYNYAIGMYKKSDELFETLKKRYPQSEYLNIPKKQIAPEPQKIVLNNEVDNSPKPEKNYTIEKTFSPFAVQVGAFVNEANAKLKADFFQKLGKQTSIQKKETTTILFQVLIEGFETEKSARNYIAELKQKYQITAIFVKR